MAQRPFKDHFSGHAVDYARARPVYPEALYRFLAGECRERALAWDCATGNGQAARAVARHFDRVIATDASAGQIAAAAPCKRVEFRVAAAEESGLDDASVNLVTCAQAMHWFDIDAFLAEANRVLKPGGIIAAWCYGNCRIEPAVDRIVQGYYESLDAWWPPERRIVESGYAGIDLPGKAIDTPVFTMAVDWPVEAVLDYLGTWSASERCRRATGREPLQAIDTELRRVWGRRNRRVTWPLHLKVARRR